MRRLYLNLKHSKETVVCSLAFWKTRAHIAQETHPGAFLPELFHICLARAKERWRSFSTGGSEVDSEGTCWAAVVMLAAVAA